MTSEHARGIWRSNVRFDREMGEDGTFLLRCESCVIRGRSTAFWPITKEYWTPSQGLARCKACHQVRKRERQVMTVEQRRAKSRGYYWADREHRLEYARRYLADHQEHINALRRKRYAERRQLT